jgi:hypothetical protein
MVHRHQPRRRLFSAHQRHRSFLLTTALLFGWAAVPAQSQSLSLKPSGATGIIQGTVTEANGKAVVGVMVSAIRTFAPAPTTDPIVAVIATDQSGAYQFPLLVPGSYRVCVTAQPAGFLDPCSWSDQPPVRNLEGGQIAQADIPLERGAFVHVRIDDAKGLAIAAEASGNKLPIVVQGSTAAGREVNFTEIGKDAGGRYLRALVPIGTDVQLSVFSSLGVFDKQGKSAKGPAPTVTVRATQQAETVRFSVQ